MLYSSENKNLTLGAETVKYLREHADDYEDIGSQDPDENLLLDKYLTEIALSTALEGKYVLTAIANITCKPIKVSYVKHRLMPTILLDLNSHPTWPLTTL